MTSDALWQLQKEIFTKLSTDSTLTAMVSGVYENVPQDSAFPYVAISDMQSADWSTKTTKGAQVIIRVDAFTRERGSKKLLEIMTRVSDLLHQCSLTLTGHTLINLRLLDNDMLKANDGLTYIGASRFRAVTQEN